MNNLTRKLTENYTAELAIIVYRGTETETPYLESHVIDGKGRMLEGRPLKEETISSIVDVFFDERKNRSEIGGLIPPQLLQFQLLPGGQYRMVWYTPAQRRHLYFVQNLHLPCGEAWVPAMVWVAEHSRLSVYALANDTRPDEKTVLYKAPYHNVNSAASVCLGSAKAKKPEKKTYANLIQYWEQMFWASEFTHLQDGNPTRTNVNLLWKRLMSEPNLTWAELDELTPHNKLKLEDLIK